RTGESYLVARACDRVTVHLDRAFEDDVPVALHVTRFSEGSMDARGGHGGIAEDAQVLARQDGAAREIGRNVERRGMERPTAGKQRPCDHDAPKKVRSHHRSLEPAGAERRPDMAASPARSPSRNRT